MKYGKSMIFIKRILFSILSIYFILFICTRTALAASSWPSAVSIEADGGILMEAQTGTVLFAKNADQPYYPASITKVLTALIVLEHCSLDEEVTFSHDDVYNVEAGSSTAGIDEGDVLTVRDCLYALMLASATCLPCKRLQRSLCRAYEPDSRKPWLHRKPFCQSKRLKR